MITGSGGLTLAKHLDVPFVQEVIAVSTALQDAAPQTDVAIELGGEDAKIIYFDGWQCRAAYEWYLRRRYRFLHRPDGFPDCRQMPAGLNEYAKNYKAIYPIAARCGVFAKTDIQPLINEGATREDLVCFYFPGSCKPDHQWSCLR